MKYKALLGSPDIIIIIISWKGTIHYTRSRRDDPLVLEVLSRIQYELEHFGVTYYFINWSAMTVIQKIKRDLLKEAIDAGEIEYTELITEENVDSLYKNWNAMTKKEFYQSALSEVARHVKVSEQEVFDWLIANSSWTIERLCLFTFIINEFPSPDNFVETFIREHDDSHTED